MYFVRKYTSGAGDHDPRQILWAEFKCGACGHVHDEDITTRRDTFQFEVEMRCPECKCFNPEDRVQNLKTQIDKLTGDKSRIETEIEQLERELNEVTGNPKEA